MSRRKERQRELKSDQEIVAAALGIRRKEVTTDLVWSLLATLQDRVSPIKDACHRIVEKFDLENKRTALIRELREILYSWDEETAHVSASDGLSRDYQAEFAETLDELMEVQEAILTAV
jgi:hypothetical protein